VFHARFHRHNTNGPASDPDVHAGCGPGSYFAHAMEKGDWQLALASGQTVPSTIGVDADVG
jgi:uncharacterized protein YfaP (DUF2135 family)